MSHHGENMFVRRALEEAQSKIERWIQERNSATVICDVYDGEQFNLKDRGYRATSRGMGGQQGGMNGEQTSREVPDPEKNRIKGVW